MFQTLRRKALFILILIGLLSAGNLLIIHSLISASDSFSATINMAGKMRMLSQRISLSVMTAPQFPTLEPALERPSREAEFESIYLALRDGGTAINLAVPALDARQQVLLEDVYQKWLKYRKAINALQGPGNLSGLIKLPATANEVAGLALATGVIYSGDQLLSSTETLMSELLHHAQSVQRRSHLGAYALFALDLLLLLVGYLLFSRRIIHPIHVLGHQSRELALGNYAARSHLNSPDELGALGQALDDSAGRISQLQKEIEQERAALNNAKRMFDGLAANTVAGVYITDHSLRLVYANAHLAHIFGYTQAELSQGFELARLFPADVFKLVKQRIQARLGGHDHSSRYEHPALHRDGSLIQVEAFGALMESEDRPAIIGIMIDITERKQAEASLKRALLVFEHTSEAMVVTDATGIVLDVNPAFTAITGYEHQDITGYRMSRLSSGRHKKDFYQAMWTSLLETGTWNGDIWNRRKSGEEYIEHLTINTSYNEDGSVNCYVGLFTDVTEKRQHEAKVWHQAHYDHLTQLPNRRMLQQNLANSIEHARRSGLPFALLFIDLDLFKEINDTFGHDEGDEVLRLVALRLQGSTRSTHHLARQGGDEFIVVIQDLQQLEDIPPICARILRALAQPYHLRSTTVHVSASMGVSFYPRDGKNATELIHHADLAMYAAKESGRNQFSVYSPTLSTNAKVRRNLMRDIHAALENNQFVLHYQPITDLQTGLITKAEALIRWDHPERGLVSPNEFITLAEDTGLIVPIGNWAFTEAVRQVTQWRQLYPSFQIGINVSPVQFAHEGLDPKAWEETLKAAELPGSALAVEITERLLIDADYEFHSRLQALRAMGIAIALDDFGTGYSSLTHLKRFTIDYLKIDQSFMHNLKPGSKDLALCKAIIVMAHQLDMRVIAEGVSDSLQHELLITANCNFGQGYWYAKPMPAQKFTSLLQAQRSKIN